jgi:hypothetical protein
VAHSYEGHSSASDLCQHIQCIRVMSASSMHTAGTSAELQASNSQCVAGCRCKLGAYSCCALPIPSCCLTPPLPPACRCCVLPIPSLLPDTSYHSLLPDTPPLPPLPPPLPCLLPAAAAGCAAVHSLPEPGDGLQGPDRAVPVLHRRGLHAEGHRPTHGSHDSTGECPCWGLQVGTNICIIIPCD